MSNKLRGNYGKIQNQLLANNTELLIEPLGNGEKIYAESRAKQEECSFLQSNEQLVALIHAGENEANNMLKLWQQNQKFVRMLATRLNGYAEGELTIADSVSSGENMEEDVIRKMDYQSMREMLWECVDSLGGKQAAVIRCRYLDNKTLKEAGEIVGMTGDAVRVQQASGFSLLSTTKRRLQKQTNGNVAIKCL